MTLRIGSPWIPVLKLNLGGPCAIRFLNPVVDWTKKRPIQADHPPKTLDELEEDMAQPNGGHFGIGWW